MEHWKPIDGYEGSYMISDLGRVKSIERKARTHRGFRTVRGVIMSTKADNGHGYKYVTLTKDGKRKNVYIHRLVAGAFLDNPDNLPCVNHRDFDVSNNRANNLEWVTQQQNVEYSKARMRKEKRTHKPSSTGEKYIYTRNCGNRTRYRVCIKRDGYEPVERSFKALEEAIRFRNSVLRERTGVVK